MELRPHKPALLGQAEKADKRSLITLILFALLFIGWVGEWPIEIDTVLYSGQWRSPFGVFGPLFAPIPGISLFPWQILLFALAPFCLSSTRLHAREMDRAILVSIGCIAVTFLWGLVRGGSAYFAYYQLWRFLAGLLIAYLLMSAVRTERDLVTLGKIIVLAALIRATLCIYFYWAYLYGKPHAISEYVTNHDDSMLFVAGLLVVLVWAAVKGGRAAWISAGLITPYVFYAVILNNRRIAWVELALSLPVIYVLIGAGPARSRINKWLLRAAPVVLVYFVAGLGSSASVFAPVHALLTTGSNYDPSSLTRQEEARNLLHTLVDLGNPILGNGWGVPYDKAESYWSNYDSGWVLTLYTPHNAILGLAAFSGLVGMIGIWGVIPVGAYLAARGYRGSTEPVPRATAMVALGGLVAYSVHCYGDIGLQSFAGVLILGVALGAAGKIAAWREAQPASRTANAPVGEGPAPGLRARNPKGVPAWSRYTPSWQRPGSSGGGDLPAKPKRVPRRRLSR